jgi:hypothetical protein
VFAFVFDFSIRDINLLTVKGEETTEPLSKKIADFALAKPHPFISVPFFLSSDIVFLACDICVDIIATILVAQIDASNCLLSLRFCEMRINLKGIV